MKPRLGIARKIAVCAIVGMFCVLAASAQAEESRAQSADHLFNEIQTKLGPRFSEAHALDYVFLVNTAQGDHVPSLLTDCQEFISDFVGLVQQGEKQVDPSTRSRFSVYSYQLDLYTKNPADYIVNRDLNGVGIADIHSVVRFHTVRDNGDPYQKVGEIEPAGHLDATPRAALIGRLGVVTSKRLNVIIQLTPNPLAQYPSNRELEASEQIRNSATEGLQGFRLVDEYKPYWTGSKPYYCWTYIPLEEVYRGADLLAKMPIQAKNEDSASKAPEPPHPHGLPKPNNGSGLAPVGAILLICLGAGGCLAYWALLRCSVVIDKDPRGEVTRFATFKIVGEGTPPPKNGFVLSNASLTEPRQGTLAEVRFNFLDATPTVRAVGLQVEILGRRKSLILLRPGKEVRVTLYTSAAQGGRRIASFDLKVGKPKLS